MYFESFLNSFESLFKMQSAAARGCTEALQASDIFQVSLEKTLKHLGWPLSLPCSGQGTTWDLLRCLPAQMSLHIHTERNTAFYMMYCFCFYWIKKALKTSVPSCCLGQTVTYWSKYIIWKNCDYEEGSGLITLPKKSLFSYSTSESSVYHQRKRDCSVQNNLFTEWKILIKKKC